MPSAELRELVNKWLLADADMWGQLTLCHDHLIGLFNKEQKSYIVTESIACGKQAAARYIQKERPGNPFLIAKEMDIVLSSDLKDLPDNNHLLLAHYENREITYFQKTLEEIEHLIQTEKLYEVLGTFDVASVMIAHEVFHCIEDADPYIATRTMKIPIRQLGIFTRKVTPYMTGEIAAFTFAQELLRLSFHPRVIELLVIWRFKPELAHALTKQLFSIGGSCIAM